MLKELKKYGISPRREIKEFLTTLSLHDLAQAAIMLFEPIYLYEQGVSLTGIALFFLGVYVPYFFLLPLGGRVAKSFGFEHTMGLGILFTIAYYLSLVAIPAVPQLLYVAPLLYALQKTFWWPAYHGNFARYSMRRETGREIGATQVIANVAAAAGPLLGGVLVFYSSFTVLYSVAICLMLVSVIPMLSTREKFRPSKLGWMEQMRYIFCRRYLRRVVTAFGFGEELVAMVFWPLFIYLVVGNALNLGALIAAATALTVIATTVAARWSDDRQRRSVLLSGAALNTLSWLGRPFLLMPLAILGLDTTYRTSKSLLYVPIYSSIYDDAKAKHVMLEVVAFEAVLVLGKILMLCLLLVLLPMGGFTAAFVAAAVASLFYFLFK